jgi:hypothetical protein
MVDIIIQFKTHTFGLTLDVDKSDIPRWWGSGRGHTEIRIPFYCKFFVNVISIVFS